MDDSVVWPETTFPPVNLNTIGKAPDYVPATPEELTDRTKTVDVFNGTALLKAMEENTAALRENTAEVNKLYTITYELYDLILNRTQGT